MKFSHPRRNSIGTVAGAAFFSVLGLAVIVAALLGMVFRTHQPPPPDIKSPAASAPATAAPAVATAPAAKPATGKSGVGGGPGGGPATTSAAAPSPSQSSSNLPLITPGGYCDKVSQAYAYGRDQAGNRYQCLPSADGPAWRWQPQ